MSFSKNIQNKYIIFKFINWNNKHPLGQIVETIGPVNDLPSFYKYELYHKNLNISLTRFNKDIKNKLVDFNDIITKYNIENRESWKVFSIDPDDSLDFDDAFSIKSIDNNILISIYISNVPIIIDYLNLWESFSERVSTIYLPDNKLPLLPLMLSDNICSLKEKETRIAFCMDILVNNEGDIINTSFKNVAVKLKYNFRYESTTLLNYNNYNLLFSIVKKMYPIVNDSHDLVAQLMILMNNYCAKLLLEKNNGIFRSTIENNNLPNNIKTLLLLSNYTGLYTTNYNNTHHNLLNLNAYTHITSPIRRIVDIINMICFMKDILSDKSIIFYNYWISKIDYINDIIKRTKKVQNICNLLNKIINHEIIYEGYIIDNETIYIITLKSFIKFKNNLELDSKHNFKLYIFNNEAKFYKKIKVSLVPK
jgi:exoribonuclease R